jgi:hypothetical protein
MTIRLATALLLPMFTLAQTNAAQAATLDPDRGLLAAHQATGAFAGARARLQIGGTSKVSAGLALAPTARTVSGDGAVRMRFGEGLALGFGQNQPVALTLAGTRVDQLRFGPGGKQVPTGHVKNMSTAGYVAIGAGVLLVAAFVAYAAVGDAATE